MKKQKLDWSVMKYLAYFTQLGFSFCTPPILGVLLGNYLQDKLGWGPWITAVLLVLGLVVGATDAVKILRYMAKGAKKKEENP